MRLLLSMLSIFLGVAFLSGTLVFTSTIKQSFNDLFSSVYKKTDAVITAQQKNTSAFSDETKAATVPRSLTETIATVPGVREVQGEVEVPDLIVLNKQGKRIFPAQGPPTFGTALPQSAELTPWRLVDKEGNNLSSEATVKQQLSDNEVLVDKATSKSKNLTIGKTIRVVTPTDVRTFRVVGYMRFGTADGFGGTAAFFFNDVQAGEITGQKTTYSVISVAGDDGLSQSQLARRIDNALEAKFPGEYKVVTGQELVKQSQEDVGTIFTYFTIFLLVFAIISFLVALVIIINSFAIIMTQRKREYALLRAIGATSGQIRRSVFVESIIVGLVASIFGVAGGIGLAVGIRQILVWIDFGLPAGGLVIPFSAVFVGIVVGTLATFVSAFFPAWIASRVPPIAALRDSAFEKNRRMIYRILFSSVIALAAIATIYVGYHSNENDSAARLQIVGIGIAILLFYIVIALPLFIRPFTAIVGSRVAGVFFIVFGGRRAFGVTGEIARRNNYRNPRRSARTSLALMIGVALVVFITVFASSVTASFSSYLKQNYSADIIIGNLGGTAGQQTSLSPERCDAIDSLEFIAASTCIRTTNLGFVLAPSAAGNGTALGIVFAVNTEKLTSLFTIKSVGSPNSLGTTGVVISKDIATKNKLALGSKVTINNGNVSSNGLNQGSQSASGSLLSQQDFTVRAILDQGLLGPFGSTVLIDIKALDKLETPASAIASFVVLKDGVKPSIAKDEIDNVLKNTGIEVSDLKTIRDQQANSLNNVLRFFYGLLALAIIIASIGILNTMSLSILERRRELGLMRAVGTTKSQVRGFIRFESIILAVLGTTIGMLFGIGSGYILIKSLKDSGFASFSVDPKSMIIILLLSAFIGVIAGAWPAWRATKVDILKAVTVE